MFLLLTLFVSDKTTRSVPKKQSSFSWKTNS